MSNESEKRQAWAKPELKKIGTIGEVAGRSLTSTNQVINDCGGKGTSCPDQLSKALAAALQQ